MARSDDDGALLILFVLGGIAAYAVYEMMRNKQSVATDSNNNLAPTARPAPPDKPGKDSEYRVLGPPDVGFAAQPDLRSYSSLEEQ